MTLAVYGIDFYGLSKYGTDTAVDFGVQPFTARSVNYGQIYIEWHAPPGDWDTLRLIRNRSGYPLHQSDGQILLEQSDNASRSILDNDPVAGVYHYYALYLQTDTTTWVRAGVTSTLAVKDFDSKAWMLDRLPTYFKYDFSTGLTTDIGGNQYIEQFMAVFAWGLDTYKTQLAMAAKMNDTTAINMQSLEQLGNTLGIDFAPEIDAKTMRTRVKTGTHVAREKGTKAGWRNLANIMTGWDMDATIGRNLLLNDDQSSFVHPSYPDWSPYTNYPSGDIVNSGLYWYQAKVIGAYGQAQAPPNDGSNNTWWTCILDSSNYTLLNPATGGMSTWEVIPSSAVKDYETDVALGQGVPNVLDEGVLNANALRIENLTASTPADFEARSVSRRRTQRGKTHAAYTNVDTTMVVDLNINEVLPAAPFRIWLGWEDTTTAEAVRVTVVTGAGPYTLTVTRAQNGTTARAWPINTSVWMTELAMDKNQPIKDGIPIPYVRDSQAWDATKEYATGDLVLYGGRPYEALRASTGVIPPFPLWSVPSNEWVAVGFDRRIAHMLSAYGHEPFVSTPKAQAAVYPYVEWYDDDGTLISKMTSNSGFIAHPNVRLATAAALPNTPTYSSGPKTLTAGANAALVVDGVTVSSTAGYDHNARILVKNQATASQNGIYIVTTYGSGSAAWVLTRDTDWDASADIAANATVYVEAGTVNIGTRWYLSTAAPYTLDTTSLAFTQTAYPWYTPNLAFDSFTSLWGSGISARVMDINAYAWTQAVGTWNVDGFDGGCAYPATAATRAVATMTGTADCMLSVTFRTAVDAAYSQGLIFRRSDDSNYWRCTRTTLRKKVAGSFTNVSTHSTAFADNDRMTIQLNGNSINVYRNHDLVNVVSTTTDSFNATATIHGMIVETT